MFFSFLICVIEESSSDDADLQPYIPSTIQRNKMQTWFFFLFSGFSMSFFQVVFAVWVLSVVESVSSDRYSVDKNKYSYFKTKKKKDKRKFKMSSFYF